MDQREGSAKTAPGLLAKLGHLGRFLLFLVTAGWLFPHVCTEDLDLTAIQKEHMKDQT